MSHNLVNYFYNKVAWETAFLGTTSKIVLSFSGAVFKDIISLETLVVDSAGNPGVAGIPAKNQLAIYTNRNEGGVFDGAIHFYLKDESITGQTINLASGEVLFNTWRHCAVTVDNINKTASVYLDGEKIATTTYMGNVSLFSTIRDAVIGRHSFISIQGTEYEGRIDDFRIYPMAVTDQDVQDVVDWGNQRTEFEERVWTPPKGVHKGKTASFRFSSKNFMSIRQLAVDYRREEIR